jgi:hypothetical protein
MAWPELTTTYRVPDCAIIGLPRCAAITREDNLLVITFGEEFQLMMYWKFILIERTPDAETLRGTLENLAYDFVNSQVLPRQPARSQAIEFNSEPLAHGASVFTTFVLESGSFWATKVDAIAGGDKCSLMSAVGDEEEIENIAFPIMGSLQMLG